MRDLHALFHPARGVRDDADVTYETFRHPVSVREGRSDFTVRLPCGIKCRARGVMHAAADRMPLPG